MDGLIVVMLCVGIVWVVVGLTTTALLLLGVLPTVAEIERRQRDPPAGR
jgi:hypothetical protein